MRIVWIIDWWKRAKHIVGLDSNKVLNFYDALSFGFCKLRILIARDGQIMNAVNLYTLTRDVDGEIKSLYEKTKKRIHIYNI